MASLQLVYLSAFLLLQHCPWIIPVTVSTDRPVVEVQEHKDAVLSCLFHTERDHSPRIEWKKVQRKDVSFVYYNGEFVGDFKGRANITGATVTLHQVTVQDTGDYRCEVSALLDTKNLGETNITLNVLVPPNVPMCEIPRSALTGTVVELRCEDVHSVPPATYSWYKDGKPLPQFSLQDPRPANATFTQNPRTGTLQFNPVSRTDTGKYHCVANNGVGDPKSCIGKHMQIDDLNVSGIVAAVVVVFLVVSLCGLGVCYAHRQGYFNKGHRGRSFWIPQCHGVTHISSQNLHRTDDMNGAGYGIPPQEDFKHAQSFML
ncbi:junctional adhesion molecule 2A isoform X1 [Lepisosteus oculatus]|uniref:junctional adhesion molecule 2A isoform X1 n=1 Tax=Lepisosteus oculatus TaxID=7918 RepID=UPI000740251E|nr:PREDICTED: junctional adhesion molecule B isoform X1 [Lepisosteus oculatus]